MQLPGFGSHLEPYMSLTSILWAVMLNWLESAYSVFMPAFSAGNFDP